MTPPEPHPPDHPREWDAATYHQVSAPQHAWGVRVLERLALRGSELVLDAGCGTGRVTLALRARVRENGGRVAALDGSTEMTRIARRTLPEDVPVVLADLLAMPFRRAFDVVFSTATFHWVPDQAALYRSIAAVLVGRGRLHAQCGGAGNLRRLHGRVRALCGKPRFAPRFARWSDPWRYLSTAEAERHMRNAGFVEVRAWLEPEPTPFASREAFRIFVGNAVLRTWMARFVGEPAEAAAFLDAVCDAAAVDDEPFTLDYVRLNLEATRAGSPA